MNRRVCFLLSFFFLFMTYLSIVPLWAADVGWQDDKGCLNRDKLLYLLQHAQHKKVCFQTWSQHSFASLVERVQQKKNESIECIQKNTQENPYRNILTVGSVCLSLPFIEQLGQKAINNSWYEIKPKKALLPLERKIFVQSMGFGVCRTIAMSMFMVGSFWDFVINKYREKI